MNPVRVAFPLLLAAFLTGCGTAGFYQVGYASTRVERVYAVSAVPACAPPAGSRLVIETTVVTPRAEPPYPVYDCCPICGATTDYSVDSSLDVHCYSCRACTVVVYSWPDGAAWAQQRCDDGFRSWRLHGTRAEPVECVPFVTPRAPVRIAERRSEEPTGRRAAPRNAEERRGRRAYDSGGGLLVSDSVRMVGHPTGLSGHPTALPSHPVGLPASPVERPSHPVTRPAAPVALPSHPVTRPAAPVALPSHPVTRPAAPVGLPSHPVTLPAAPVGLPSHPVERPSHPVLRPGAMAPAAAASRGSPAPRRNPLDGVLFNRADAK